MSELKAALDGLAVVWEYVLMLAPYWPWLIPLVGFGIAYRLGGWPGVAALAFGYGVFYGRKSAEDEHENVDGKDAAPVARRPTIFTRKKK